NFSKVRFNSLSASGVVGQNSCSFAAGISALQVSPVSPNRASCRCRAALTRCRIWEEGSPGAWEDNSSYSTGGTSTCRSIRSRIGPESRDRYRSTALGVQVQGRVGWPKYPQGQGFMAATSINRQG